MSQQHALTASQLKTYFQIDAKIPLKDKHVTKVPRSCLAIYVESPRKRQWIQTGIADWSLNSQGGSKSDRHDASDKTSKEHD